MEGCPAEKLFGGLAIREAIFYSKPNVLQHIFQTTQNTNNPKKYCNSINWFTFTLRTINSRNRLRELF